MAYPVNQHSPVRLFTCGRGSVPTETSMLLLICSTEDPHTMTASAYSPLSSEWWYIHPRDAFGKVVPCAEQISLDGIVV